MGLVLYERCWFIDKEIWIFSERFFLSFRILKILWRSFERFERRVRDKVWRKYKF